MIKNNETRRKVLIAYTFAAVAMLSVSGGYFLGKQAVKSDVEKCFVRPQVMHTNVAPDVAMQCVSLRIK